MSRTAHIGANGATLTLAFYHADAGGNITKMINGLGVGPQEVWVSQWVG